ncbi:MAG: lytic transglycosylase domain-containing protein [Gammaproteobacteria bacterium]
MITRFHVETVGLAAARVVPWLMPCVMLGFAGHAAARTVEIAVPVPVALVQDAVVAQVFVGPGQTAQVLEGRNACNVLALSEASVAPAPGNRLRLLTRLTARGGTPLTKGRCLPLFEWTGRLEVFQQPHVLPGRLALGFRVTDSNILGDEGERRAVPGVLWNWIKDDVQPRLESYTLDLEPLREGARDAFAGAFTADAQTMLESIAVTAATVGTRALELTLTIDAPDPPAGWQPAAPEPALDLAAIERWRAGWQTWDAFVTWLVKHTAERRSGALGAALADALLEARHDLVTALTRDTLEDPVPMLFLRTWDRLVPLLTDVSQELPAARALRYLTFITAADALRAVNGVAPQFGFRLDRDSLRRLARILAPTVDDAALAYDTSLDPALRELLGFAREFPLTEAPARGGWQWLIADALAASGVDPAISERLRGWVPGNDDLDAYLDEVAALFDQVAAAGRTTARLESAFIPVYETLLRATAWQETCWRQFVAKNGRVEAIRSSAGSVGIMQINTHVWRGVYELNGLLRDVGYNARAGNEILLHYLLDYAVRRREHTRKGGVDNLARATYAMYNGGPGHRTRYREPGTSESLRRIDAAFFEKYRAIRRQGADAVKQCYGQ